MHFRLLCSCMIFSILPIIDVLCQDTGCISADSLLEGRRRIVGVVFRASNSKSGNRASQARLGDDGWCSRQLATDIFDPYIEINFAGRDVLFSSIATQGVPPTILERAQSTGSIGNRFIERYRVEVAGENDNLQYITPSAMSFQPAIFPLGQTDRISSTDRHRESLPRPVIGQTLRINPYQWNDEDYVCTRLEVYGCPLQECRSESQLNSDQYVDSVTVSGSQINTDDLFNFGNARKYCGPTSMRPFTITITYTSPVLLREIGIDGRDRGFFQSNWYVTSFSLSFSEDGDNFTEYIRDTGSTEFTVPDHEEHFFALWPPITASSIRITINDWSGQPCMSLLMVGCYYSDVVDHNGTVINDSGLVDDMTVVLTTTESVTTTETIIKTITEHITTLSFTVTVTTDSTSTPSPSPTQSSNAAGSTSCSSDTDNRPIYVAVAIVIVGLLITIIVVIVGVLLCCRHWQEKQSSNPLTVKCSIKNSNESSLVNVGDRSEGGRKGGAMGLQPHLILRVLHRILIVRHVLRSDKLKLEVSKNFENKQVESTSLSAPTERSQTINLQYESVCSGRRTVTNYDYAMSCSKLVPGKNNHSSTVNNITSNNDPTIEDNPAYSITSGPPLVDNPAYNVI